MAGQQFKTQRALSYLDWISPFAIGGISGAIATAVIQPIDTFKVQIQVISEKLGKNNKSKISFYTIFRQIQSTQGLSVFYRGLDSAIFRQIFYGSARLGSYNLAVNYMKNKNRQISKLEKVLLATISGVFGAIIGNPFDVALVRRQASISNGKNSYKNTFDAFKTMIRQQGVLSLWTGINITILRVVLINIGQLASRQIISDELDKFLATSKFIKDNLSATLASVLTAFISLPADNIKVKLQKQLKSEKIYNGIFDCLKKTLEREGVFRLWVGFPIYLIRGFPHSFILIRVQQLLNQIYAKSSQ